MGAGKLTALLQESLSLASHPAKAADFPMGTRLLYRARERLIASGKRAWSVFRREMLIPGLWFAGLPAFAEAGSGAADCGDDPSK